MSQDALPSLQFDRAELGAQAPNRVTCTACARDVFQSYYTIGSAIACSECRDRHERGEGYGSAVGRFFRANGAAVGTALAGAFVWWAVRALTEYELGIIAIGIGIAVARAIQWGTRGRTNAFYRVVAVLITYFGIAMSYVPELAKGMAKGAAVGPLHVIVAFVVSFAVPAMAAAESPILIIIILFGLYNAWKHTARVQQVVQGPFSVTPAAAAPMPAAVVNV